MKNELNNEWKEWTRINLNRGVDINDIFITLFQNNFKYNDIIHELNIIPNNKELTNDFKEWVKLSKNIGISERDIIIILFKNKFYNEDFIKHAQTIDTTTKEQSNFFKIRYNEYKLPTDLLDIYKYPNFLTNLECDNILNKIKDYNKVKSTVTNSNESSGFRTSKTIYIPNNDFFKELDNKLDTFMNIPNEYSEPLQIQYYEKGDEFKLHTDYFGNEEYNIQHLKKGGNRTFTIIIYLNDVAKGGETLFKNINTTILPDKGTLIFWNNLDENNNGNYNSLHSGCPVLEGTKYIITKWYRIGKYK